MDTARNRLTDFGDFLHNQSCQPQEKTGLYEASDCGQRRIARTGDSNQKRLDQRQLSGCHRLDGRQREEFRDATRHERGKPSKRKLTRQRRDRQTQKYRTHSDEQYVKDGSHDKYPKAVN